ncbi:uncharacterized protein K489DRAFT_29867 [Dissoconium aciculare CBS 342.82]|uniref:Uncharacterized protein n=1 Tax=Dissoconium aciculare CBS 342.82 TaxID=1314786 RepID=A0A6J3MIW1_9PEZI|nr:uncharacterized protein K489DRAFT_29867 [Dissoconium aciculare CBS 342.82]KAF1827848.1 hypothetical protein K489DRAFT_29867 [Dissoconium aciculare CBS 342.82]
MFCTRVPPTITRTAPARRRPRNDIGLRCVLAFCLSFCCSTTKAGCVVVPRACLLLSIAFYSALPSEKYKRSARVIDARSFRIGRERFLSKTSSNSQPLSSFTCNRVPPRERINPAMQFKIQLFPHDFFSLSLSPPALDTFNSSSSSIGAFFSY